MEHALICLLALVWVGCVFYFCSGGDLGVTAIMVVICLLVGGVGACSNGTGYHSDSDHIRTN